MNHCIRVCILCVKSLDHNVQSTAVLDIIDVPADGVCLVVMEEWSSHLLPVIPSTLRDFLSIIHQCIEVPVTSDFPLPLS